MEEVDEWHPTRSYLDEIKTAGLRAKDVVRQLLSFSRKSEQQRKPLNIVPLIDETMKLLRSSIPTTIEIRSDIVNHLGPINADATQIQQVIINLCTNAAQAMEKEGGLMEVSLTQVDIDEHALGLNSMPVKGPYVQIAVRDTGHGIDTKIQNRIFDPYFTTKEVSKGSGMGLAIVHGIVTSHDGAISVDSEIGKGTTIKVLLPVCKQRDTEEETVPNALPTGTEKILFVDDERSIVKMMTKMLGRLGYQIESKTNPIEALALFQSKPHAFDLVITDMNMPQMTGAKLAEKIMETRNDLPIIVCTGHSPLIDEKKAKKLGIAALAIKPIVKQQIAMTIRRVLDASKIELPTAHRMY